MELIPNKLYYRVRSTGEFRIYKYLERTVFHSYITGYKQSLHHISILRELSDNPLPIQVGESAFVNDEPFKFTGIHYIPGFYVLSFRNLATGKYEDIKFHVRSEMADVLTKMRVDKFDEYRAV